MEVKGAFTGCRLVTICSHMFTDKKNKQTTQTPFGSVQVLSSWLVEFVRNDSSDLKGKASFVQHSEAITQPHARTSSSWSMSNHFLSVFNSNNFQNPNLVSRVHPESLICWPDAEGTQSSMFLDTDSRWWCLSFFLSFFYGSHWLFCNVFVESKVNLGTSSTACEQKASQELLRALQSILTFNS